MVFNIDQLPEPDKKQKRLANVGLVAILIVYVITMFLEHSTLRLGLIALIFISVFMVGYVMIRWKEFTQIPKGISIMSRINAVEWFMMSDEKRDSVVKELKTSTRQDNRPISEKIATWIGMTILILILSGGFVLLIWGVFFQDGQLHL